VHQGGSCCAEEGALLTRPPPCTTNTSRSIVTTSLLQSSHQALRSSAIGPSDSAVHSPQVPSPDDPAARPLASWSCKKSDSPKAIVKGWSSMPPLHRLHNRVQPVQHVGTCQRDLQTNRPVRSLCRHLKSSTSVFTLPISVRGAVHVVNQCWLEQGHALFVPAVRHRIYTQYHHFDGYCTNRCVKIQT
jgi:hypothetical protein